MKNILIGCALFLGTTTAFSQEITSKEKKGDKHYFLYNYDEAVAAYNSSKTLSVQARRRLAESHAKMGNFKDAEVGYSYLVNDQSAVITEDYFNYAMVLKSASRDDDYALWMNKFVSVAPMDLRAKSYVANSPDYQKLSTDTKKYKVKSLEMNSDSQDYGTAFYKDGIVFTSTKEPVKLVKRTDNWTGLPYSAIYQAKVENSQFTDIKYLDKKLNSKMHDGPASFNADGTKMAFTTNNQKDKSKDKIVELQIFTSTFENGKWSKPVAFKYNNSEYSNGQPHLSADGKTMYFTSDMPGGFGGTDLYVSTLSATNDWTTPVNLGDKINTESDEMFAFFEENNDQLFFASNGHFGLGGLDILTAYKMNDQFGVAKNIGSPFNTAENDFAYIVNPTTKSGFISSNRFNGKGSSDIYSFSLMENAILDKQIIGITMNTQGEFIGETFVVLQDSTGKGLDSLTSDATGAFSFEVENDRNYILKGTKNQFSEGQTKTSSFGLEEKIVADIILVQKDIATVIVTEVVDAIIQDTTKNVDPKDILNQNEAIGKIMELKPIYYVFDKVDITKEAAIELNQIVKIMNKFPNLEIELASYTDCRGSIHYNDSLSQLRAKTCIDYIQKRITTPQRIYGNGYGESNLANACACEGETESPCSENEHRQNRRTEFIIKK